MTFFELVNLSSGNLAGDYESEEEARADIRLMHDPAAIAAVGLFRVDDEGGRSVVAEGAELFERAGRAAPAKNGTHANIPQQLPDTELTIRLNPRPSDEAGSIGWVFDRAGKDVWGWLSREWELVRR